MTGLASPNLSKLDPKWEGDFPQENTAHKI